MIASVALTTGQPVGDLLDLLGLKREWPEVFDELLGLLDRQHRKEKRENLQALARKQFGG